MIPAPVHPLGITLKQEELFWKEARCFMNRHHPKCIIALMMALTVSGTELNSLTLHSTSTSSKTARGMLSAEESRLQEGDTS